MAYTRKQRRRTRNKTRKVKKGLGGQRNSSTTLVNNAVSPLPSRYITKMKYATSVTLSGTGLRTQVMNLNSIFDPDRTAGGHRPYGYSQLLGTSAGTGLYNRYRVISASYVISAANSTYNIQFAALPSNNLSPPISDVSEARENPRCRYLVQNPGGTLKVLKGKLNINSLLGRTKTQYMGDDSYGGTWNGNPSELALLNLYVQGLNDDTGVDMTHVLNILMTYTVELYDPNSIDQSA